MNRLLSLIAAAGIGLTASHAAASSSCTTPQNVNDMASEIAAGVNANRAARGLQALQYNATLGQAAMKHACDMSVNNFFGHSGSDGSSVGRRVQAEGYRSCLTAENLAWGYPTSGQIISGWMNSSGHRSNMLLRDAQEMGIGITQGPRGPNWVLVLAKGC
ncbi:CAP domain-containing protein [Yoonia sp. 208BN28-4]|uniref:CAP domain-containing protein n=1 Tax=Yoonia sp. 208BN28-4 TaxID=3126505 RepID=UPI0030AEBA79